MEVGPAVLVYSFSPRISHSVQLVSLVLGLGPVESFQHLTECLTDG